MKLTKEQQVKVEEKQGTERYCSIPCFFCLETDMKIKWKPFIPAMVVAMILLLFRFALFIGYVPTESMEPTLKVALLQSYSVIKHL